MNPEDREEIKRHFGVVAEGLRAEIRLLADGVAANTERLGGVETRVEGVETRLGGVETRLGGVETRLGGVENRLGTVETRLDGMDNRLGSVETDLRGLRGEVRDGFVEVRSMIKLSYSELDRRLTTLEGGYGDLRARMERVEAKVAS